MGIEAFGWHAPVLVVDLVAVSRSVNNVQTQSDTILGNDYEIMWGQSWPREHYFTETHHATRDESQSFV